MSAPPLIPPEVKERIFRMQDRCLAELAASFETDEHRRRFFDRLFDIAGKEGAARIRKLCWEVMQEQGRLPTQGALAL